MIPAIFAAKSPALKELSAAETLHWERSMSGALIGIAGAVGALGGVGINVVLRASYAGPQKSATTAFWVFLVFYIVCLRVTWASQVGTRPRRLGHRITRVTTGFVEPRSGYRSERLK
jgi:MFS transporter, NNP family, nitrate/nitrite transporter